MKPSQTRAALELLVDQRRPVFLWGAPGIGKSDIVYQLAHDRRIGFIDKRLSQSDPTELKGLPWPDAERGVMRFLRDDELPVDGEGILFLDEMNNAPASVQAPAYQLILNRRLGKYVLPDGWAVVAAGNRSSDRSVVHKMAAALANRFVHIDMQPDTEDWIAWALNHGGISPGTIGYIRYRPANLYTEVVPVDARAFPSPRSWMFADKIANDTRIEPAVQHELIAGTVGEGCAVEYLGFIREAANLPNIEAILLAPEKVKVPSEPSTLYAVIGKLEHNVTPGNFETLLRYAKRMPKEYEVVFAMSCARNRKDIIETAAMTQYIVDNRDNFA